MRDRVRVRHDVRVVFSVYDCLRHAVCVCIALADSLALQLRVRERVIVFVCDCLRHAVCVCVALADSLALQLRGERILTGDRFAAGRDAERVSILPDVVVHHCTVVLWVRKCECELVPVSQRECKRARHCKRAAIGLAIPECAVRVGVPVCDNDHTQLRVGVGVSNRDADRAQQRVAHDVVVRVHLCL